nr:glycoside hydrolase family 31 protein [Candidatus Sigynarchaeota archaeon]
MSFDTKTILRLIGEYAKQRIKHPFSFKRRVMSLSEPRVIYGLSDHPLDKFGEPFDVFTFLKKALGRIAYSIRKTTFKAREGNSFDFTGYGTNIFVDRPVPAEVAKTIGLPTFPRFLTKPSILTIRITFLKPGTYRLRCALGGEMVEHDTPMVINEAPDPELKVDFREETACYSISTTELVLKVYKDDFRIEIVNMNGEVVTESSGRSKNDFAMALDSFPLGFIKDKASNRLYGVESFLIYPGEAIYGLGEHYSTIDKVGSITSMWNSEGSGNASGRAYKNIPFFMSTRGYGVFVNEHAPVTFWTGSRELCKNMIAVESSLVDYYFFHGPSFKTILDKYTDLTGKAPVPPKWSFGAWMSRISYGSQDEVIQVAKRLRDEKYPFDVIHVDTNWFAEDWMCDWQFGPKKFPDPKLMNDQLHEMGFKLSLWQAPYVLNHLKVHKEAKKANALAKNHGPFMFMVNPATPIDFSRPEGVGWYKGKLKALFDLGAHVIKTDFGEGIEPHMEFNGGEHGKYNGRQMHNLYPLLYQKAAFDASWEYHGEGIIWARSAYSGCQRYPVHWSGDSSSTFEEMLNVLRGGLSLGMSGFTYWSHDVGGFAFSPFEDELYIRWTQFAVFCSHIRYHGMGPRFREPWNYGVNAQRIVRQFLELRYRMLPYIYTEAHHASQHGLPMVAPLVLEFQ